MGCIIVLLAAILCTMIFGPAPVLVLAGLGAVLAALTALGAGIGETIAAIRRALPPRRSKLSSAAVRRREPIFNHPAWAVAFAAVVLAFLAATWLDHNR